MRNRDKLRSSLSGSIIIEYKKNGEVEWEGKYKKSIEGQKEQFSDRKEWTSKGEEYTFDILN